MTSESQRALGPSEQLHLLYIDPFLLDRRNFDPNQLPPSPSNNPLHGQDPDVEVPSAAASVPEPQTHVDNSFHPFDAVSPSPPEAPQSAVADAPGSTESVLTCPLCLRTFSKPYLLKYGVSAHYSRDTIIQLTFLSSRHTKSHTRDFKCSVPGCPDRGSRYRKDLVRHMRSMHPELEGFKGFHCSIDGCSRSVGKAFLRKDNFLRHMATQHPDAAEQPSA